MRPVDKALLLEVTLASIPGSADRVPSFGLSWYQDLWVALVSMSPLGWRSLALRLKQPSSEGSAARKGA